MGTGEYGAAEERITKVMDASIWRCLINAYEPVEKTVMPMLTSMKGDAGAALEHAKDAVKVGLPLERLVAGPRDAFA